MNKKNKQTKKKIKINRIKLNTVSMKEKQINKPFKSALQISQFSKLSVIPSQILINLQEAFLLLPANNS